MAFVHPDTRQLTLSDGRWLLVRRRLSTGERREMYRRTYLVVGDDWRMDPTLLPRAKVTAYLLDWNITDDGTPVPIFSKPIEEVDAALDALDPLDFDEIHEAIKAHETKMTAEREAEKKTRAGASAPNPISPSPSEPVGVSIGSVRLTPTITTS